MIQRHVYEIIVVKHKDGNVVADEKLVATSSEAAMAKANLVDVCKEKGLTPDDVEYIILKLGSLRPIQEVANEEVSKF